MSDATIGLGKLPSVTVRRGTADAWHTLASRPGAIAYLGASVTQQQDGFRPRLHARLEESLAAPRMVNAGVGAVGSMAGLFYMDDLVLPRRPELCLVEFLTADIGGYTPMNMVTDAVNGIAEKLLGIECTPVFLYLTRRDVDREERQRVVDMWEAVADRWGVGSIDMAPITEGLADPHASTLFRDEVHTTTVGADLVADGLFAGLAQMASAPAPPGANQRGARSSGRFARAHVRAASTSDTRDPGAARRRSFRFFFEYIEIGSDNRFEITLDEELIGLSVIVGPGAGVVRVGRSGSAVELDLWDQWCHYDRLGALFFPRSFAAGERVTIEAVGPSPRSPDQSVPPRLAVIGFMVVP